MGTRSPEFGWYVPDRQELIAADLTLHRLSRAALLSSGGTWTPEQAVDADKLAGFLRQWGPWAKATAQDVAEQRERMHELVAVELLDRLAEVRANLDRYTRKRHEWDRQDDPLGLLGGSFTAQLDKCDPVPAAIAAPAASPRPERRKVDAASRRTTKNRPRPQALVRTWKERERLRESARSLGLAPGPQQLLAELIDKADARGTCWPSTRTLGDRLGVDVRSVRRYRSELEAEGLVTVDNYKKRNGRQGASTYRLHLALLTAAAPDHVTRADRPDHVIRADRPDAETAQLVAVAAETLESALRPNVIRADKMSGPEQKDIEKKSAAATLGVSASPLQAQLDLATAAFAAQLARREQLHEKEATATQLQAVDKSPAVAEIPGAHTPQLVEQLVGAGAILAAQALRENRAGVERCVLIAEKNSTGNPAGYLLIMLRQGQHRWIVEEQERSEWSAARSQRHLVAV
ncbi:MAG: helix-turn-helix domain-containing protein [Chloroflexi bacterium]|nr:helix-turn-helix domain-containing protein [Chloroflexota bacterium]